MSLTALAMSAALHTLAVWSDLSILLLFPVWLGISIIHTVQALLAVILMLVVWLVPATQGVSITATSSVLSMEIATLAGFGGLAIRSVSEPTL